MPRRNVLFLSVILFSVGVILTVNYVEHEIVLFINRLLNIHLEVVFRSFGLFYCGSLLIVLSFITGFFYLSGKEIISRRQFYFFSSALLVIFYFFFLWKDAVNIPITDDYKLLAFLDQYIQKTTFAEKWQLLLQPINECRQVVPKLYFLAVLKIFGGINFKWLVMANGCLLLLICALLFNSLPGSGNKLFRLAFLFMVLQFQSFDLAFWTTSGICHYLIFIFMIISFKAVLRKSCYHFLIAIFFSLLACFTFGNGFLVFPVGCLLFLLQGRIKQSILFALIMVATVSIYFYAWPYPKSNLEFNPSGIFIYALGFLGSSMQFFYSLYIPVLAGFLCICVFIYATVKQYYRKRPFIYAALLFIILTAFITAPFRLDSSPLQSRYGLYSIAAIVLCLIMIVEIIEEKQLVSTVSYLKSRISMLVFSFAISYNFLSGIMFYPEAPVRSIKLQNFVNDWKKGKTLTYSPPVIPDDAEKYLINAEKSGIWHDE